MEITRTLYCEDRGCWRRWLQEHYRQEREVWLVYYRKEQGRPRVSYNDAVEEALCFGWIDSIQKKLGEDRLAQRYSPRRPGVPFSQPNVERLRRMADQGLVASEVLPSVQEAIARPFHAPADILAALRRDKVGWTNFMGFSEPYQRIRIAFVDAARETPEVFARRFDHLLRMNAAGRQFGHDLESYY
jgi:hypothetical protein